MKNEDPPDPRLEWIRFGLGVVAFAFLLVLMAWSAVTETSISRLHIWVLVLLILAFAGYRDVVKWVIKR